MLKILISIVLLFILLIINTTICFAFYSTGDWFIYRITQRVNSFECILYQKVIIKSIDIDLGYISYSVDYLKIQGDYWACVKFFSLKDRPLLIYENIEKEPKTVSLFTDPQHTGTFIINNTILKYQNGVLVYAANYSQTQIGACCTFISAYTIELVNSSNQDLLSTIISRNTTTKSTTSVVEEIFRNMNKALLTTIILIIASFILGSLIGYYLSAKSLKKTWIM
jgi:uncharacterized integral membrane protein